MANKTSEDFENQRKRQVVGVRSVLDYLIALVFIIVGIVAIVKFKPDWTMVAFGALAIVYGIRRGYTGYTKNRDN